MHCPNCLQNMTEIVMDNQKILHCENCGSSFFEENGINRISIRTAEKLAQSKKGIFMPETRKVCPRDNTTLLLPIRGDEAIPQNVQLMKCASCRGIFAYPNDLVLFKKAQEVKIEFYKTWGTPLPSLRSVLVLSFFALIGASLIGATIINRNANTTSTQATDIVKYITAYRSGRYIFVSFRTETPMKSTIAFKDLKTGQIVTKTIANEPTSLHYATFTDLPVGENVSYQVTLTDDSGKSISTDETSLQEK